jgi:hypothetical protein
MTFDWRYSSDASQVLANIMTESLPVASGNVTESSGSKFSTMFA